jgi:hypothetical protein
VELDKYDRNCSFGIGIAQNCQLFVALLDSEMCAMRTEKNIEIADALE